jgi:hypothetical protein
VKLGSVAAAFGKGIFAGVAETAAMAFSSTIEMKVRGRPASSTPALAAAKVLGVEPVDEEAMARFSNQRSPLDAPLIRARLSAPGWVASDGLSGSGSVGFIPSVLHSTRNTNYVEYTRAGPLQPFRGGGRLRRGQRNSYAFWLPRS